MDATRTTPAEQRPTGGWRWLPAWALLLAWQGWLTLGLFGSDPFTALLDDRPIRSGSHAQHQYLGTVGAQALWHQGRTSVFDTAFQAGYPKTPIFDGSRLAEFFLFLGGGTYRPAAYKIGLACMCLLVPILLLTACKAAGLSNLTGLLAAALGMLVWWGPLGRSALEAGDSELLLASLAGLAHVGFLVAFHHHPGVGSWLGLLVTGILGWFLQPLLFPIALPLLLSYYLSVGVKHEFSTWHVAFWLAEQGAVLANLPWLIDWLSYWWLRSSLPVPTNMLAHRTLATVWNAPLWGGPADRALAVALMLSALAGVIILNQTQRRPAARLLGTGAGGALALALLGISWEPLGLVGTSALLAPALWFAALPAAHAWTWLGGVLLTFGLFGRVVLVLLLGLLGLAFASVTETASCLTGRCVFAQPLSVGLSDEQQDVVEKLTQYTTSDARVLWEDRRLKRKESRWAALLPLLTGRSFVGGLDPDGFIEHSRICLMDQALAGRPIATWTDEQLAAYCRRYNVGWVVGWSPAVCQRFQTWPGAEKLVGLRDGGDGVLFRVKRTPTYTLQGQAELLHADRQYITLGNVTPENGVVVLSLHYQNGMVASPSRVVVEREPSGADLIDFVRLRLAEPAARVTITWDQ